MVSKIQALRDECLERLKSKNDLEKFQNNISFEKLDTTELTQFVNLCDNRIDVSKTFLNVTTIIMGFIFTGLSIALSMDYKNNPLISSFLVLFSILLLVAGCFFNNHMSITKGWTAFKEMALMYSPEKIKESKTSEEELDS